MKVAIIQFPGATGIQELKQALLRVGLDPIDMFGNDMPDTLNRCAACIIVGGETSQGSFYLSVMAARSSMMQAVKEYAAAGKLVLGIAVGAQILIEAGLILDVPQLMALTENRRIYFDRIVGQGFCYTETCLCLHRKARSPVFTLGITPPMVLRAPLAQTEGRFVMTEAVANFLEEAGLIVFQYCDASAQVVNDFPINPNASVRNIAAISNDAGNVLAIVPRLERSLDGDFIFSAMRDFIEEKEGLCTRHRVSIPPALIAKKESINVASTFIGHELFYFSPWLEQETRMMQQWLHHQKVKVNIKRYFYWNIDCSTEVLQKIKHTEILTGPQKAWQVNTTALHIDENAWLILNKDDIKAAQKLQLLTNHFEVDGIKQIKSGILWLFLTQDIALIDQAQALNFIFNPLSSIAVKFHNKAILTPP